MGIRERCSAQERCRGRNPDAQESFLIRLTAILCTNKRIQ